MAINQNALTVSALKVGLVTICTCVDVCKGGGAGMGDGVCGRQGRGVGWREGGGGDEGGVPCVSNCTQSMQATIQVEQRK